MLQFDPGQDPDALDALLEGIASTQVAVCLCDAQDRIRYANPIFRAAFFADQPLAGCTDFMDAIAVGIASGQGIKLESMSLDTFSAKVRERRKSGPDRVTFSVDMQDGTWWLVNDFRASNGWILVVASDISGLKNEEFRLRDAHQVAIKAAETDALTGVANRRSGMNRAEEALREFQSNRLPLVIAILDLDHFKAINDAHGHAAGDEVLISFAKILSTQLGIRDHVSRIGGEEFMVIMPDTTPTRGAARLDRLRRSLQASVTWTPKQGVPYSFSAGLADARRHDDLKTLLSRADATLYLAKVRGRNQIKVDRALSSSVA